MKGKIHITINTRRFGAVDETIDLAQFDDIAIRYLVAKGLRTAIGDGLVNGATVEQSLARIRYHSRLG